MIGRLGEYFRSRKAVSALEYAAIVALIIVGLGVALNNFRNEITDYMNSTANSIDSTLIT